MSQERFFQLLSRKMAGEASSTELAELDRLMQENEEWKTFEKQLMTTISSHTGQDEVEANAAFDAHSVKIKTPRRIELPSRNRGYVRRFIQIAAILVAVAVGFYLFRSFDKTNDPRTANNKNIIEAATKRGIRSATRLVDGTTVWLNSESKLTYEKNFTGNSREVTLTGEAFFEVVKERNRPFIVHASGIDVTVTGTAFNVKSYPDDRNVEITLYRGAVRVYRKEDSASQTIELRPNQKLVLAKRNTNEISKQGRERNYVIVIDSSKQQSERTETAWMYNRLEFRGDNFEELARKLERWYDVTIVFTDEKAKQMTFNGSLGNETIEQVMATLKKANPSFNYKININNREILIGYSNP